MTGSDGEVIVLTTVADTDQAALLSRGLVEQRLAACVTCIGSGLSFFRWKSEAVTQESEQVLLIKTRRDKLAEIEQHFETAHPYEVPEFVVLEISALSTAYGQWMHGELMQKPKGDA
ncbi:MAG TPA: divalent-cation tolerance protein CutA [bacterium]|jgi:periplasmic divalent cation tolerance protein